MATELKPCPFCGSEAEVVWWGKRPEQYWIPRCSNRFCCGRLTKKFSNVGKAIKFWNKRAASATQEAHGHWIKIADLCGIEVLKCSVCGKEHPRLATAYCCDCGAKMDGDGNA